MSVVFTVFLKPLIQSMDLYPNFNPISFFVGFMGSWIAFFLGVYAWRYLLVSVGLMTKAEAKANPFCLGIPDE